MTNLFLLFFYVSRSWEVYWDEPKGAFTDFTLSSEAVDVKDRILQNVLDAAKLANIKHMVVVDDGSILPQLELSGGVPYTCIRALPRGLTETPNYTFKDGIRGDLAISSTTDDPNDSSGSMPVCREDLAALCVQSLQSLSWDKRRVLTVSSNGPVRIPTTGTHPAKRVDQQWCVNSFILEEKLAGIA
jgi:hypothetical protein